MELDFSLQSFILILGSGLCIFSFVYMIGKILFTRPELNSRLEETKLNYGLGSILGIKPTIENQYWIKRKKQEQNQSFMKTIIDKILKTSLMGEDDLKLKFEQAGWITKDGQSIFLAAKILCLIICLCIGFLIINYKASLAISPIPVKMLILFVSAILGWIVPNLYLRGVIKNRIELVEKQFPDALDLMIICMQAGLSLNRTFERVSKEMYLFGKEIGSELANTSIELEILLDRRHALQNLYKRVPSKIIRTFSTTILQSMQQGTPILVALDILSKEIRDVRMQKAENKAARLPSLMVIPLVLFVMPNLFIILLGPAIVRLLNVT